MQLERESVFQNLLTLNAIGGGQKVKSHYGRIEDIVRDMFDGSDLYLVNVLGKVKTYKAESLLPLKKDKNKGNTLV